MVVGLEEVMDISSAFMITFALTLHGGKHKFGWSFNPNGTAKTGNQ
jgi:hypothetical protein